MFSKSNLISRQSHILAEKNYPQALPDSLSLPQKEVEKKLRQHFHQFLRNIL